MNPLICALAATRRALSVLLRKRGATRAANSAMIVTTTSISIRVTPACAMDLLREFFICLHCDIVDSGNRQHHAEDHYPDDDAHHQDDQRFEQGCELSNGGPGIDFVDVRHSREHLVELAGLLADAQQVSRQRRELSGLLHRPRDAFAALHALRYEVQ